MPKLPICFFEDPASPAGRREVHAKWWFSVVAIVGTLNEEDDRTKSRSVKW